MTDINQQLGNLIASSDALTEAVAGQVGKINDTLAKQEQRITAKEEQVDNFISSAQPEKRIVTDITIGGSSDYLYPVWFTFPQYGGNLKVWRYYSWNSDTKPLNPLSSHQSGLFAEIEGSSTPWSGNPRFMHFKRFDENYNRVFSHPSFKMNCFNEKLDPDLPLYGGGTDGLIGPYCYRASGFYLRGGGIKYQLISNWNINVRYSDKHEATVIGEDVISETSGSYKWSVKPIPFAELKSPIATLTPFDSMLQSKA